MARAYKKTYLNGAMRNLAVMMDCGVRKYVHAISWVCQGLSWPTVWWRLPVELS